MLKEVNVYVEKVALNAVDLFFFLSAFLITSHALREYKYTQSFSLRKFFIRRVFRIAPVLIIALLFTFVFHPWMNNKLALHEINLPDVEPYLFLLPNYFSSPESYEFLYLIVVASIYLFIQFYFFWGLILKFLKKYLTTISIGMILLGLIVRILHFHYQSNYFLDTMAYGAPIGIGGYIAYAIRSEAKWVKYVKELSKNISTVIYVIGAFLVIGGYQLFSDQLISAFVPIFTGIFYGYIIIEQTFGKNSFFQLKNQKILTYLGRMSYGLIVYQSLVGFLVLIAFESLEGNMNSTYTVLLVFLSSFVGSVVAANISFKMFEKPMLRLRREFKKV